MPSYIYSTFSCLLVPTKGFQCPTLCQPAKNPGAFAWVVRTQPHAEAIVTNTLVPDAAPCPTDTGETRLLVGTMAAIDFGGR